MANVSYPGSYIAAGINSTGGSTTATISTTVSSGTNSVLVVCVCSSNDVTGITYNGNALTKAKDAATDGQLDIWYLVNPTVTTANTVITFAAPSTVYSYCIFQLNNVNQTSPIGNTATSSTAEYVSLTMSAGSCAITVVSGGSKTPSAGNTEMYDPGVGTNPCTVNYRIVSAAGTYIVGSNIVGTDDVIAVEFKKFYYTEGPYTPSTSTSVNSGSSTVTWASPSNANADDGAYTTCTAPGSTASTASRYDYLQSVDFGFNIPTNAIDIIVNDEVQFKRTGGSTGNIVDDTVRQLRVGSLTGSNKANASSWGTTDTTRTYGGDNWGITGLSAFDVNNWTSGLAFRIKGSTATTNRVANIDYVKRSILYDTQAVASITSTGWLYPSTSAAVDIGNANSWSNTSNALTANTSYASVSVPAANLTNVIRLTNFNLSGAGITNGATIYGIQVKITGYSTVSDTIPVPVLTYNNTHGLTSLSTKDLDVGTVNMPTSASDLTLGGQYDIWASQLSSTTPYLDSTFGVDLYLYGVTSGTCYIDSVAIKIHYVADTTSYPLTLTASATGNVVFLRTPTKIVKPASTTTTTVKKDATRTLSASLLSAAATLKNIPATVIASLTGSSTLLTTRAKNVLVSASATASSLLTKAIGKNSSQTSNTNVSLVKSATKNILASSTSASTLRKTASRILSQSSTATATNIKSVAKHVLASTTSTVALVRGISKLIGQTVTISTSKIKSIQKKVGAVATASANAVKGVNRTLSDAFTTASTALKNPSIAYSTAFTSASTLIKNVAKTIAQSVSSAVTWAWEYAFTIAYVTIETTVNASSNVIKNVGKVIAASSITASNVIKSIAKVVSVLVSSTVLLLKSLTHTLRVSVATSSNVLKAVATTILAIASSSAVAVKEITLKAFETALLMSSAMNKNVTHIISSFTTGTSTLLKSIAKTVASVATSSVANIKDLGIYKSASITSTSRTIKNITRDIVNGFIVSNTLNNIVNKTLAATYTVSTSLQKVVSKTVRATTTGLSTLIKSVATTLQNTTTGSVTLSKHVFANLRALLATASIAIFVKIVFNGLRSVFTKAFVKTAVFTKAQNESTAILNRTQLNSYTKFVNYHAPKGTWF